MLIIKKNCNNKRKHKIEEIKKGQANITIFEQTE